MHLHEDFFTDQFREPEFVGDIGELSEWIDFFADWKFFENGVFEGGEIFVVEC